MGSENYIKKGLLSLPYLLSDTFVNIYLRYFVEYQMVRLLLKMKRSIFFCSVKPIFSYFKKVILGKKHKWENSFF